MIYLEYDKDGTILNMYSDQKGIPVPKWAIPITGAEHQAIISNWDRYRVRGGQVVEEPGWEGRMEMRRRAEFEHSTAGLRGAVAILFEEVNQLRAAQNLPALTDADISTRIHGTPPPIVPTPQGPPVP